jgi:hypothetical protein
VALAKRERDNGLLRCPEARARSAAIERARSLVKLLCSVQMWDLGFGGDNGDENGDGEYKQPLWKCGGGCGDVVEALVTDKIKRLCLYTFCMCKFV